jgi:hypothetical protein
MRVETPRLGERNLVPMRNSRWKSFGERGQVQVAGAHFWESSSCPCPFHCSTSEPFLVQRRWRFCLAMRELSQLFLAATTTCDLDWVLLAYIYTSVRIANSKVMQSLTRQTFKMPSQSREMRARLLTLSSPVPSCHCSPHWYAPIISNPRMPKHIVRSNARKVGSIMRKWTETCCH